MSDNSTSENVRDGKKYDYVIGSIYIVEQLVSLLFNLAAVYVLSPSLKPLQNEKKSFGKLNGIFLLTLFAAHAVSCINGLPAMAVYIYNGTRINPYTRSSLVMNEFIFIVEVLTTITLSIDRYLAIKKPFMYQNLTEKHAYLTISVILFLGVLHTIPAFLFETTYVAISSLIIIGCIAICICNYRLFAEVKQQCKQISTTIVHRDHETELQMKSKINMRLLKSLKMCLVFVLTFLMLWMPFLVIVVLTKKKIMNNLIYKMMQLIAILNGIFDPLTFFVFRRKARKMILKLLCWFRKKSKR